MTPWLSCRIFMVSLIHRVILSDSQPMIVASSQLMTWFLGLHLQTSFLVRGFIFKTSTEQLGQGRESSFWVKDKVLGYDYMKHIDSWSVFDGKAVFCGLQSVQLEQSNAGYLPVDNTETISNTTEYVHFLLGLRNMTVCARLSARLSARSRDCFIGR